MPAHLHLDLRDLLEKALFPCGNGFREVRQLIDRRVPVAGCQRDGDHEFTRGGLVRGKRHRLARSGFCRFKIAIPKLPARQPQPRRGPIRSFCGEGAGFQRADELPKRSVFSGNRSRIRQRNGQQFRRGPACFGGPARLRSGAVAFKTGENAVIRFASLRLSLAQGERLRIRFASRLAGGTRPEHRRSRRKQRVPEHDLNAPRIGLQPGGFAKFRHRGDGFSGLREQRSNVFVSFGALFRRIVWMHQRSKHRARFGPAMLRE